MFSIAGIFFAILGIGMAIYSNLETAIGFVSVLAVPIYAIGFIGYCRVPDEKVEHLAGNNLFSPVY
ncbi:hypothetical protein SJAV_08600 [Sulfurisphaera javensis]|uniref:Uncharacterized protein n=1 Tax=Sulfurisphaera javensis TaxID=2049879 RepID=A0AAT9GPS6_9CREN